MGKLPKHHPGQIRRTVSLSISIPVELEAPLNQLAVKAGMNRSQVLVELLRSELRSHGLNWSPRHPMRVRRLVQPDSDAIIPVIS